MPPVNKLTAWSFSRYSAYKLCPFKLKLTAIDKLKEPVNEAMERGGAIHKLAEDFVKSKSGTVPPELTKFKDLFLELRKNYKKKTALNIVEDSWAMTVNWVKTGWFDRDCWVRIKLDHAISIDQETLIITDWKTGKFKPDQNEAYQEQLELYALAALILYPHIKVVKPRLAYLDLGIFYPEASDSEGTKKLTFTQVDVKPLMKAWEKRVKPMLNDTKFAPRPNWSCRFCFFSASKNGPCKF